MCPKMIVSRLAVLLSPAFAVSIKMFGEPYYPPSFITLPHMWALIFLAHLATEAFSIWTGCSGARHQLNPSTLSSNFPAY